MVIKLRYIGPVLASPRALMVSGPSDPHSKLKVTPREAALTAAIGIIDEVQNNGDIDSVLDGVGVEIGGTRDRDKVIAELDYILEELKMYLSSKTE